MGSLVKWTWIWSETMTFGFGFTVWIRMNLIHRSNCPNPDTPGPQFFTGLCLLLNLTCIRSLVSDNVDVSLPTINLLHPDHVLHWTQHISKYKTFPWFFSHLSPGLFPRNSNWVCDGKDSAWQKFSFRVKMSFYVVCHFILCDCFSDSRFT